MEPGFKCQINSVLFESEFLLVALAELLGNQGTESHLEFVGGVEGNLTDFFVALPVLHDVAEGDFRELQ